MTALGWIVAGGLAMTTVAGAGAVFAFRTLSAKTTLVLVALSAGSLLGGALFHMMPAALARTDDRLAPFVWLALGFSIFFVLEQFVHWHHCHGGCDEHTLKPVGSMILRVLLPFAAGNFIYIAAADLIPEIKHHPEPARSVLHFLTFMTGMAILLGLRLVIHE